VRTLLPSVLQLRKARSLLRAGLDRYLAFDLVGAEELFTQAVRTSRQAGSTATIVDADEHLYLVLRRRRRHVEAVPVLEELATGHSRLGGPGGDAASAWRNELIATLGTLDRFAEAEPLCRAAVELAAARHGTASRQAAYARVTQAWCLRHLNRWSEAAAVSRQALADLEAGSGAEAPVTGWALVGLASALLHLGEPEAAEECLLRAHGNWDRVGESALADATLSRLIDLYLAGERFAEALATSDRRRRLARGRSGAQLPGRAQQLWDLDRHAFLLRAVGREEEANRFETRAAFLRQAIESEPRPADGSGEDPEGPLFDCEPVADWAGAGTPVARAC